MLNNRQEALIELLKLYGKLRVSEICFRLSGDYRLGSKNSQGKNTNCPALYKDVDLINEDLDAEYILCKKGGYIWIANYGDAFNESERTMKRALHYLKNYWNVRRKLKLSGQFDMLKEVYHQFYKEE